MPQRAGRKATPTHLPISGAENSVNTQLAWSAHLISLCFSHEQVHSICPQRCRGGGKSILQKGKELCRETLITGIKTFVCTNCLLCCNDPVTLKGTQCWKGQPDHQWQRPFSAGVNNHFSTKGITEHLLPLMPSLAQHSH